MQHCRPPVTSYPAADVQCVLDCAAGTCNEDLDCKTQSHANVASYCSYMSTQGTCPPGPCDFADLKAIHVAKGKTASPINWLALLTAIITALLNILNPPTPTPAQKGKP